MTARILIVALAGVLALAPPAAGQSQSSGRVEGVVTDSEDRPVRGARVLLREEASGASRAVTTGVSGGFEFAFLPPGKFSLLVEHLSYRPEHVVGIPVWAGGSQRVRVTLTPPTPPVERVDTVVYPTGAGIHTASGSDIRLMYPALLELPGAGRELGELARLSTLGDPDQSLQGLPGSMTALRIDGVPVEMAGQGQGGPGTGLFPLSAFGEAALIATDPDVEWTAAAGALQGSSLRGGGHFQAEAFGSSDLQSGAGGVADGGPLPVQGGFSIATPLVQDTVSLVLGLEAWRLDRPWERSLTAGPLTEDLVAIANDSFGIVLPERDPRGREAEVVSGFAGLSWMLGSSGLLGVRTHFASGTTAGGDRFQANVLEVGGPLEETSLWSGVSLASQLRESTTQELRVSFEQSDRSREPGVAGLVPNTRIVGGGLAFGAGQGLGSIEQRAVRASETVTIHSGAHRIKLGLAAVWRSVDQQRGPTQEFLFSGADEFARSHGYFVQSSPETLSTELSLPGVAVFVQDTWIPAPGLSVLLGLRYDAEQLPREKIEFNEPWAELTGQANSDLGATSSLLQPRFGFTWDVQNQHRWIIDASAGLYAGTTDSRLLGELLAFDVAEPVRRGFGDLGGWPGLPASAVVVETGPTLTLAAPRFGMSRTARGTLGLSRALGTATIIRFEGLYRYTDHLPRRGDLNLRPDPVAEDRFGQPIFGEMEKQGNLLIAGNGSNRRFHDVDRVFGISADGWSRYAALSTSLEHRIGERFRAFGSYTFSRTTDNWPAWGFLPVDKQIAPNMQDAAWSEGRSDLDVPHRLVLGSEAEMFGGLRLAALYRYRSGDPFTPGYREGVDANADGVYANDVAVVDSSIEGLTELASRWDCLQSEGLPDRNACRTSPVYALDARASWEIRAGRYRAELVVDGLNLLAAEAVFPDRALYLVDPAGEITRTEAGVVTVPLLVNDDFGDPLVRFDTARTLRLGIRVRY